MRCRLRNIRIRSRATSFSGNLTIRENEIERLFAGVNCEAQQVDVCFVCSQIDEAKGLTISGVDTSH